MKLPRSAADVLDGHVTLEVECIDLFLRSTGGHGCLKISCVPMRRQMTCGSPSTTASPYWKVARPSSTHVISKSPVAAFTPLTRKPFRNCPPLRTSSTNWAMATRKAAC